MKQNREQNSDNKILEWDERYTQESIDDASGKTKEIGEIKFEHNAIIILQNFEHHLQQFQKEIQQRLTTFFNLINSEIIQIKQLSKKFKNKIDLNTSDIQDIQELQNKFKDQAMNFKIELMDSFQNLNNFLKIETLLKNYESNYIQQKNEIEQRELQKKFEKQILYKVQSDASYQQKGSCYALTFNEDGSRLIASCGSLIKIFSLEFGKLREIQQLIGHKSSATCLKFMNRSMAIVSAGVDAIIIVWIFDDIKNGWINHQILKGHSSQILCLTVNCTEDIIASGSFDNTIIFWKKINNIWNLKQQINCMSQIFSVDFSYSENKLLANIFENKILILEQINLIWIKVQEISVKFYGFRSCFINKSQFVFQPHNQGNLKIFSFNNQEKQFQLSQEFDIYSSYSDSQCFNPLQFIQPLDLLFLKLDSKFLLISGMKNLECNVDQILEFQTKDLFGCISNTGQSIATWDSHSKEFQIRKLII